MFQEEKKWEWASTLTESFNGGENSFTVGYTIDHVAGAPINIVNTTPTINEGSLGRSTIDLNTSSTLVAMINVDEVTPITNMS